MLWRLLIVLEALQGLLWLKLDQDFSDFHGQSGTPGKVHRPLHGVRTVKYHTTGYKLPAGWDTLNEPWMRSCCSTHAALRSAMRLLVTVSTLSESHGIWTHLGDFIFNVRPNYAGSFEQPF